MGHTDTGYGGGVHQLFSEARNLMSSIKTQNTKGGGAPRMFDVL